MSDLLLQYGSPSAIQAGTACYYRRESAVANGIWAGSRE